jgi:hypothetical protein
MNLKVGGLIAAAVMGVVTEIGSQFVSQKWDEIAEQKGLPKTLSFGRAKDDDEEETDETE